MLDSVPANSEYLAHNGFNADVQCKRKVNTRSQAEPNLQCCGQYPHRLYQNRVTRKTGICFYEKNIKILLAERSREYPRGGETRSSFYIPTLYSFNLRFPFNSNQKQCCENKIMSINSCWWIRLYRNPQIHPLYNTPTTSRLPINLIDN